MSPRAKGRLPIAVLFDGLINLLFTEYQQSTLKFGITNIGRDVRIKVLPEALDPERVSRFQREANGWPYVYN